MRTRAALPLVLGSAFTVAEAEAVGLSRRRLDRPDLDARFRGVRMLAPAPAEDDESRDAAWRRELLRLAAGYRLRMGPDEFFSHAVAAVIWGLPVAASGYPRLDVSVPHPGRASRSIEVRGHQVRPKLASVVEREGYRISSPATTWAMLGATCPVPELVVLGDAVAHIPRRPGGFGPPDAPALATLDQLGAAIDAGRRRGIDRLRAALPLIRTGAASRRETEVRLLLTTAGLPEPELDVDVRDEQGRFLGCSELAYPRFRVALEYEGDHHRTSRQQWNRDIDKYQLYAEADWAPIRITSGLYSDRPREVVRRVEAALRGRGWRPA